MTNTSDSFSVVLPSNSSMQYYPDNKTTRFVTHLPHVINLPGRWSVAMTEIHIPMTFLHISPNNDENYVSLENRSDLLNAEDWKIIVAGINAANKIVVVDTPQEEPLPKNEQTKNLPHGVYNSVTDLLDLINELSFMKDHVKLIKNCGGYVSAVRLCDASSCKWPYHFLHLAPPLKKILGFSHEDKVVPLSDHSREYSGVMPASLSRTLPQSMYVYTDICESYITGDVHGPLLRIVPLEIDDYKYGSLKIKTFSAPLHIPLLRTEFHSIEVDIRDEYGTSIPFEYGTLTVTLHFKRIE